MSQAEAQSITISTATGHAGMYGKYIVIGGEFNTAGVGPLYQIYFEWTQDNGASFTRPASQNASVSYFPGSTTTGSYSGTMNVPAGTYRVRSVMIQLGPNNQQHITYSGISAPVIVP